MLALGTTSTERHGLLNSHALRAMQNSQIATPINQANPSSLMLYLLSRSDSLQILPPPLPGLGFDPVGNFGTRPPTAIGRWVLERQSQLLLLCRSEQWGCSCPAAP